MNAYILENVGILESLKKARVDPDSRQPYLILVCLARSSADSMGDSILSTVRNAAKLAVYEEVTTRMNSHHIVAMIRVDTDLCALKMLYVMLVCYFGTMSEPCCMREPTANHIVLSKENSLMRTWNRQDV